MLTGERIGLLGARAKCAKASIAGTTVTGAVQVSILTIWIIESLVIESLPANNLAHSRLSMYLQMDRRDSDTALPPSGKSKFLATLL